MKIITRKKAIELDLKRYFTGNPCPHGHVDSRYTSNGHCTACLSANSKRWAKNNRGAKNAYARVWGRANRDKTNAGGQAWREANREKSRESSRRWARINEQKPPTPEKKREYNKRWSDKNRGLVNHLTAKRRADKALRTPLYANPEAIKFFYEFCPKGCHVDHIIPLRGKNISGFHIETNLQWLPASKNLKKSNKFTGY